MAIYGYLKSRHSDIAAAPCINAVVFATYSGASGRKANVQFLIDTGADSTQLSLHSAIGLIGATNWSSVLERHPKVIGRGIGGTQEFHEVPMRIYFWDDDYRDWVYHDLPVFVPRYSWEQYQDEKLSTAAGWEPLSLLGRDVLNIVSLHIDTKSSTPVVLDHSSFAPSTLPASNPPA